MKVLFLTLLLGLVCSAQEEEAEQSTSELSGQWRTVYFASCATEKTNCDGLLRLYICKVVFNDEEGTVDIYLCVELDGKWEKVKVTGKKEDDNTYVFEYEGTKRLKVAYVSDTVLVLCVFSVDENGVETPCAVILAVKVNIEDEALARFKELVEEKKIEEKYIVNFLESDDCPPCGLQG